MALKIMPHGRLQEWVAEEKGYFTAEGLEYSFVISGDYGLSSVQRDDAGEIKTGAFETFGAGRSGADVSCACHWATNTAGDHSVLGRAVRHRGPARIADPPPRRPGRGADRGGLPLWEPLRDRAGP